MQQEPKVHGANVLILTTASLDNPNTQQFHNHALYRELIKQGVSTTVEQWRNPEWTTEKLSQYSHITFLSCLNYVKFKESFDDFLEKFCFPAKTGNPTPKFLNPPEIVRWNGSKMYLKELEAAGFLIPVETKILSTVQTLDDLKFALAQRESSGPMVIKPSISANTGAHLVHNPKELTEDDVDFLSSMVKLGLSGSIMLQDLVPRIKSDEYSLIYIAGVFSYAYLTIPAEGEYRASWSKGATSYLVDIANIPQDALDVGKRLSDYIAAKFHLTEPLPYARVDGIVSDKNKFILMEIELVEPDLVLDRDTNKHNGLLDLCKVFTS